MQRTTGRDAGRALWTHDPKEHTIEIRETDILVRYRTGQYPANAPQAKPAGRLIATHIKQIRRPQTLHRVPTAR